MENTVKTLMFDLASGREIFDEEQSRVISKAEANEVIRKVCFEELGLTKDSTDKQIKRALKSDKAMKLMEVIEEVVDVTVAYGLSQDDFFNNFVETKNMKDGDRNEFWVDDEVVLTVSKVSGDHHDLSIQRLGAGSSFSVPTSVYGIKVGGDIRLFLTGRKDWTSLIDAVAKAFVDKVLNIMLAEFNRAITAAPQPPVFKGTGSIVKTQLDTIIEQVEAANAGSSVVIMGTKTALKNLNALAVVNWADPAASVKEAVARTGIIGNYEGTDLMVLPQKFTDKSMAASSAVLPNNVLYIMPLVDNKFVKFVDYGETTLEVTGIGEYMDDMQTYEAQRRMGVGSIISRYFGTWTI